jgi:hypothetical protein
MPFPLTWTVGAFVFLVVPFTWTARAVLRRVIHRDSDMESNVIDPRSLL